MLFSLLLHKWPKRKFTNFAGDWGERMVKKASHWAELLLKMGTCKYFSANKIEAVCLRRMQVGCTYRKVMPTALRISGPGGTEELRCKIRWTKISTRFSTMQTAVVITGCRKRLVSASNILFACLVLEVLKASEEIYNGGRVCSAMEEVGNKKGQSLTSLQPTQPHQGLWWQRLLNKRLKRIQ